MENQRKRSHSVLPFPQTERLERMKDDFPGMASHELKTPCNSNKSIYPDVENSLKAKGKLKQQSGVGKSV